MRFGVTVTLLALFAAMLCSAARAQSGSGGSSTSTGFCDRTRQNTASQQDHILRFAAAISEELEASGSDTVIISRSGLDLSRFHIRYSHAAVLTRSGPGKWTARQLYYACDEGHPRIFDQGLAGFAGGSDDPALAYISIVVMPPEAAHAVRLASEDRPQALGLLAATYSANAYAFSTLYQNCNQWVIELLAQAWGNLADGDDARASAQRWLMDQHYDPEPVNVNSRWLMFVSMFSPMLHLDDHPQADRDVMRLKVSLPSTIETFVRQRLPESTRLELGHTDKQIVVHRGWTPVGDGCQAGVGDKVMLFE